MIRNLGTDSQSIRLSSFLRPQTAGDTFVALFCLWWLLLVIFHVFPQIDIAVARFFYVPGHCSTDLRPTRFCTYFPYSKDRPLQFLREVLFLLPYVVAIGLGWMLYDCLQEHGATFQPLKARKLKLALASLMVGPVIVVNLWLKTFSGRPRPRETDIFGGTLDFVNAGSFAGKCTANCSFVSGEAAAAGWLFCLLFVVPQPLRAALILPLTVISIVAPALRVAFGGHYLSDAVLGWLSSPVIFSALFALSQTTHNGKISEV